MGVARPAPWSGLEVGKDVVGASFVVGVGVPAGERNELGMLRLVCTHREIRVEEWLLEQ